MTGFMFIWVGSFPTVDVLFMCGIGSVTMYSAVPGIWFLGFAVSLFKAD